MKNHLLIFLIAGVFTHSSYITAQELVTYSFEGTVTNVSLVELPQPLGFNVSIGERITGTLTYDLSASATVIAENSDGPNGYLYTSPRMKLTYSVGHVTVTTEGPQILLGDGVEFGGIIENPTDTFVALGDTQDPSSLTAFLRLEDTTRTVFSDAQLTPTLPLPSFDLRRFELQQRLSDGSSHLYLEGSVRTLTRRGKQIAIDIKPKVSPNVVDAAGDGALSVAVLTTNEGDEVGTFDATRLNPMSISFGGKGRDTFPVHATQQDVDRDGDIDLLLRFRSTDVGFNCADATATLRAQTFGGRVVQGSDTVVVSGCAVP